MKKNMFSIRLFFITIVLLFFIQIPVFASTGKSTATNVRVRKEASTNSEVLHVLALDEKVEIIEEAGDWYKVKANGYTGYVSKSFVKVEDSAVNNTNQPEATEPTTEQPEAAKPEENNGQSTENNTTEQPNEENNSNETQQNTEPQKITKTIYKIAENTQVYILPVLTSEVINETKKGEDVTLISNAGLWVYIQTSNTKGWIRVDKLSTETVEVENNVAETNKEQDNNVAEKEETPVENKENNTTTEDNTNAAENNNEATIQQQAYTPKTMYVKSTTVNVRSKSNTSSDRVTSVSLNTQVKVVGEENGWYKVEVNGKSGYIRKDLLSDKKTEVTSRDNNVDRNAQANNNASQATVQEKNESANQNSTQTTTQATTQTTTQVTNQSATQNNNTQASTNASTSVPTSSTGVTGNDIVAYAKQFVGCRYVYGAAGPNSFDCSGLTMYVYKHFGYSLSHSSKVQATQGKPVTGELQPGDILVFTNGGKQVGHVGIYIGNDKFVHASDSTTGVIISNLSDRWNKSKYVGARRIL